MSPESQQGEFKVLVLVSAEKLVMSVWIVLWLDRMVAVVPPATKPNQTKPVKTTNREEIQLCDCVYFDIT